MNPVHYSSDRHDWGTPRALFDVLHQRHRFELDVAANAANHKLHNWLGPDHPVEGFRDALALEWQGLRCWMNPPYGRQIGAWVEKAEAESLLGSLVVCLLPARTDTAWWHDIVMKEACRVEFIRGRLAFDLPGCARLCKSCAHNAARKKGRPACPVHRDRPGTEGYCSGWKAFPAPFPSAVVTFSAEMGGPPRFDSLEVPR